jgi:hypothetical protein
MADIFISYCKQERELSEALAKDLTDKGYTVWWDTHLLADDRFGAVIDGEIEACTRAIIIWTPRSIKRDWVVSEAQHAHRLGKLVNIVAEGLDPVNIPKPFGLVNAVALEDRTKIIATIDRAKKPTVKKAPVRASTRKRTYPITEAAYIVQAAEQLTAEAKHEGWEADPDDYAIHLITAADELLEAIAAFEKCAQSANLVEFTERVWLRRLQRAIEARRHTVKKEIRWLSKHTTHGVISGARNDLQDSADALIAACIHARRQ